MINPYHLLLPPVLAILFSRFIGKRRLKIKPQLIAEFLFDCFFCVLPCIIICLPLERMAVKVNDNYSFRCLEFGKVSLVLYCAICAVFGCLQGVKHWHFSVQGSEPSKPPAPVYACFFRILEHAFVLILFVLTFSYGWSTANYNHITLAEVFFYLLMPLTGTAKSFTSDLFVSVFLPALLCFGAFEILSHLHCKSKLRFCLKGTQHLYIQCLPLKLSAPASILLLTAWLMILYAGADQFLKISDFINGRIHSSTLIEDEYADPDMVNLTFPEQKRNLIHIYVESAETTNQDIKNGGVFDVNYTPEMTLLAQENVSFSHSNRLEGAAVAPACGWTIAGLVAQTAGLPLKFWGYDDHSLDNLGEQFSSFLPGATSLGDILQNAGYRNIFMAGSDFTFGGRRQYFTQHGDYEIWDYLTAKQLKKIPEDYYTGWGFEDQKLYAFAKEMLTDLAQGEQPFNLTLLTVDTHDPGFLCSLCPIGNDTNFYPRALRCSSAQVANFISWCQQQPFYENTTIVVTGDHASMTGPFYSSDSIATYDKHAGDTNRLIYNAFINPAVMPVQEENRRFTTLDVFPTTLAAMGVSIEGERLGLGVNLFSDEPTLSEIYGYETLFAELNKRSDFYDEEILFPKD